MGDVDLVSLALEAIPKAVVYAAAILAVGAQVARLLVLQRASGTVPGAALTPSPDPSIASSSGSASLGVAPPSGTAAVESALARVGLLAALVLVAGLLLRAWAHTAVSFGFADSMAWENLSLIAWESQWGEAWKLQLAGAAILVVFTWAIGQVGALGWTLSALAAVAACFLLPLLGHAEGVLSGLAVHGAHILGGGVWVGTLMAMALALRGDTRDALLQAFAPVAFTGAAVLAGTGLVAAYWYLQSPFNIASSPYGWAFALKMIFVADVATFGFLNWRRFHAAPVRRRRSVPAVPATTRDANANAGQVFVVLEVVMAMMVILITAVMTELEHP